VQFVLKTAERFDFFLGQKQKTNIGVLLPVAPMFIISRVNGPNTP